MAVENKVNKLNEEEAENVSGGLTIENEKERWRFLDAFAYGKKVKVTWTGGTFKAKCIGIYAGGEYRPHFSDITIIEGENLINDSYGHDYIYFSQIKSYENIK